MRRIALLLTMLLGGSLVPAPHAVACGGPLATLDTFMVTTKWSTKKLHPGEKARIEITVVRPNDEDPARQHIPTPQPFTEPVEGASVGTTLYFRNGYTWGAGVTDAAGKVVYEIEIPKNIKPGLADAPSAALLVHNEGGPDCTQLEEVGYTYDQIKVLKP